MQINFVNNTPFTRFQHRRSETEIIVIPTNEGVSLHFLGSYDGSVILSLENKVDLEQFLNTIPVIEKKSNWGNEPNGFHHNGIVINALRNNYGDPYEESIEIVFSLADPEKEWDSEEVYAELDVSMRDIFIDTVKHAFTRNS